MKVIIDRFEGDYAVVENSMRQLINMPKQLVPQDAVEGDVLSIELDKDETGKRRSFVSKLIDQVWKD